MDVYPTVLRIAGAQTLPGHAMGEPLQPIFKNPKTTIREVIFSECAGVGAVQGQGHRMARSDRYKYVLSDTDEAYLFDLNKDPAEITNRINDKTLKKVRDRLRQELLSWMKQIGDRTPN
ncbi:MAG: DUF4976 domain-containing protein [Verrucomicrobiae bacterium]|nr:DUF4976 domain-containing protein [Verrucomicrobiae bacterium]